MPTFDLNAILASVNANSKDLDSAVRSATSSDNGRHSNHAAKNTPEFKAAISRAHKGKIVTTETKAAMSKARTEMYDKIYQEVDLPKIKLAAQNPVVKRNGISYLATAKKYGVPVHWLRKYFIGNNVTANDPELDAKCLMAIQHPVLKANGVPTLHTTAAKYGILSGQIVRYAKRTGIL
jgi:hypothetical protein